MAQAETEKVLATVKEVKIKNQEDLDNAIKLLSQVKTTLKGIQAKKDAIIRPLNLSIKEVRELFQEPESKLTNAERSIKMAILNYQQKIEAAAKEKARKIEEKNAQGKISLGKAVNDLSKIERVEGKVDTGEGSVQFKTIRKVQIVNVALIPARYFATERVLEALRVEIKQDALSGVIGEAEGVKIVEEKTLAGS